MKESTLVIISIEKLGWKLALKQKARVNEKSHQLILIVYYHNSKIGYEI